MAPTNTQRLTHKDVDAKKLSKLILQGLPRHEVMAQTKCSRRTYFTYKIRLVGPDLPALADYDWESVQNYYDSGRSFIACASEFKFSISTIKSAIKHGYLHKRPLEPQKPTTTAALRRRQLERLVLGKGYSFRKAAKVLNLSTTNLRYWAHKLSIQKGRQLIPNTSYSKEYIESICVNATSIADVIRALGWTINGTKHQFVKKLLAKHGINPESFKAKPKAAPTRKTANEILVLRYSGPPTLAAHLKRALLEVGVPNECARCQLPPLWQAKPLKFHVHHKTQNRLDNRRENLELMCPNCHSQEPVVRDQNILLKVRCSQ